MDPYQYLVVFRGRLCYVPDLKNISLLAAFFSLVGCTIGALSQFDLISSPVSPLVFFGLYCLLIGYLILRSTFLPRVLGVLMAIGGLGWLTFLWTPLADYLSPYNLAPGIIGETALTLWLLIKGVAMPAVRNVALARADVTL